jgi:hypothetical protein
MRVLPDRVTAILQYPPPANLKALRRFMGMVGFYGRFIPEFSRKSAVLHDLKKKGVHFEWRAEHQAAFEGLKRALSSAPVLQIPDFGKDFVLATDASERAISAVLQQRVGDDLAPISYYSRVLSPAERQYSVYEKECLAVLFGCEKARSYLEHKEFELYYDNLALCWLLKRAKDVGRLGLWVLRLSPFKFKVTHTRGVENVVADALSRVFDGQVSPDPPASWMALLQSLPLVYSSLSDHQSKDPLCVDLRRRITDGLNNEAKFQLYKGLLVYCPRGARRRLLWCLKRYVPCYCIIFMIPRWRVIWGHSKL